MVKKQEVKNYTVQEFYNRILYKLMQSIGIKHDEPRSMIQEKMYIVYKLGFENFGDWHNFSGTLGLFLSFSSPKIYSFNIPPISLNIGSI